MATEIQGNWLSAAFDECRKFRLRRREIECLVAKITGHGERDKFPTGSELERVIEVGLDAADATESKAPPPHGGRPSPGRDGALALCAACKVKYEELADA